MNSSTEKSHVIIGGGPAGLTAAYELTKRGVRPTVFEQSEKLGGISRTETYKGYRFDIGGHRFYTKVREVERIWHEVMGSDFLTRPRLSRIYYGGKFYRYPIKIGNTLGNLGVIESARIMLSYLRWKVFPYRQEETLEHWVTNRFGDRLYRTFFKTYTEKVWGVPCSTIRADWAAQRIKGMSLREAVTQALLGTSNAKSLIEEFQYPRLGPGMMWEQTGKAIRARGGEVKMSHDVGGVQHNGTRVESVTVYPRGADGAPRSVAVEQLISTMPISRLVQVMDPQPPETVLHAARSLAYRDFLTVVIIVDKEELFPDNWIYIHDPESKVGRIQNFKNWSPEMVPDSTKTSLGMEYFCSEGDELWEMEDDALIELARREIDKLGLAKAEDVIDGTIIRQKKAYPVYDGEYRQHLAVIQAYLDGFENLHAVGRNGMHRYNNQDHSMLTAMLAVKNIFGEAHNLWEVNTERSYHEEFTVDEKREHEEDNISQAENQYTHEPAHISAD